MATKSKCVSYKRTVTTTLKTAGILNIEDNGEIFISTEQGDKELHSLIADFQGAVIELSVTVKDIHDLADPSER